MPQVSSNPIYAADPDSDTSRLAVGQFLALAESANVFFDLINDRLVVRACRPQWQHWKPVRQCLDEIGIQTIERFFRTTTPEERQRWSRAARPPLN
jgi:hypothetical protein